MLLTVDTHPVTVPVFPYVSVGSLHKDMYNQVFARASGITKISLRLHIVLKTCYEVVQL